jgi:hypothetical protein
MVYVNMMVGGAAKKKPVNDEAWIITLPDVQQFVAQASPDTHVSLSIANTLIPHPAQSTHMIIMLVLFGSA